MNKQDCIFCKIAKEEIPSVKIWEDKDHIAILDINPATRGHTLIITKEHYENIFDIPENLFECSMKIARKIAFLLKEKLGAEGINILNSNNKIAQQEIPHFHIHVIPRYKKEKFKIELKDKSKNKDYLKIRDEILRENGYNNNKQKAI